MEIPIFCLEKHIVLCSLSFETLLSPVRLSAKAHKLVPSVCSYGPLAQTLFRLSLSK